MALRDYKIKPSYSKTSGDDIASTFYIPIMSASNRYDRATGYFGSTIYLIAWKALKSFISNGGKMRIMCSPYLSNKDQDAINEGGLHENISSNKLFQEFKDIFEKEHLSAPERVLACLISMGYLEVKVATGEEDPDRLFHDKVGIFYDDDSSIGFRGSINETFKGLSNNGNFESIDAFTSWGYPNDVERLTKIEEEFDKTWSGNNALIHVYDLSNDIKSIINKHAKKEAYWETALDEVLASMNEEELWSADKTKGGKRPRPHQLESLKNWENNNRRGIFEHATGSGKTFTAMCAIRKCLEENTPVLILVPSTGLLNQWKDEMMQVLNQDMDVRYLLCGDNNNYWKNPHTLEIYTRPRTSGPYLVTIAVMDTAISKGFINRISTPNKLLVVADEVHRMGSPMKRAFFNVNAKYRLGLSATPKRYNDPVGTKAIMDYFGGIIKPTYSLNDAIRDHVLCEYFYSPNVVKLTEDEQERWDELSTKISREYAIMSGRTNSKEDPINSTKIKNLLIQRSRIIKEAKRKVDLALSIISSEYEEGQRWIVYCDNTEQLNLVLNKLLKAKIRAYQYHSELAEEVKKQTLSYFKTVGGVIVSIRCLDEGIDIPSASHALILASSQNPREFIQRRGRVLRRSENKNFAYLYDALVIPNDFSKSDRQVRIVETELLRAIEFGKMSVDSTCIVDLNLIAINNDVDINNINQGYEED